jgi:hypothetical protein
VIQPPRAGPTTLDSENTPKKIPWYLALRAGSGKTSAMLVKMLEKMNPAPRPWMPRKMINSVIPHARPQSTLPTRKIAIPARMNHLRPYMSPSFPTTGIMAVEASR